MSCQKHKELLERWWNDRLTEGERAELEAQLFQCEDCRRELEGSRELWELMGHLPVPEPSEEMQVQFTAMLESYKATESGKKKGFYAGLVALRQLFVVRPALAAAFSVLLVFGGFGLGLLVNRQKTADLPGQSAQGLRTVAESGAVKAAETVAASGPVDTVRPGIRPITAITAVATKAVPGEEQPSSEKSTGEARQLEELTAQVHEMRELMMLSLLQNPSASERMRAVSYTSEIRRVNPKIAEALLATLNSDPNVNVRLTTLEALTHFSRDPVVREGLIASILQQDSPLVQAAMADVMMKLQEKRAIQPFKTLLQQKDLNGMVRSKIEQTITRLT
jgi:hypothetical protein